MNPYLVFILGLIVFVYLLESFADVLNVGRLTGELPQEFREIYDPAKYTQSLRYQKERVNFELLHRTVSVGISITFILLGGFQRVDQAARSLGWGNISTGLVFVTSLSVLKFFSQLPFSLYDTFVLEAKYGFNKTTFKTYLSDLIKGAVLGSILGGLILSGLFYFFETAGPNAWLYSWGAFTLFQTILMYLAPAVIMPLFNKFQPLPSGPLREAIEKYAKTRNFQLSGIFTMDSSKRSTKSNAFFTGFGKFRRLVLFDTLITKQTQDELVAILAHEIGHFEKKHIIKTMALSILSTAFIFYTIGFFMNNPTLFAAFQMENISVYGSLIFVGFLYGPILRVLSLFTQALSRKHEFEADRFAVETYGSPETLISALKKLSVDHLSHLTPHPLKIALDYSHPPILQRIEALRK